MLVSSRLGMVGIAGQVMYTAAKGGLIMLGKGAAIELAPRGIRVNVAAPGLTSTAAIEAGFDRQPDPDAARRARAASHRARSCGASRSTAMLRRAHSLRLPTPAIGSRAGHTMAASCCSCRTVPCRANSRPV